MTDQDGRPNAAAAGTFALGGTGGDRVVNRLGFGAMRLTGRGILGEPEDPEEARRVLQRAVELGVNLIDTANSYGPEVSEHLHEACEGSLRRLKVERIDLYQLHTPDPKVAFEDSVWALALLRDEGKI